MLGIMFVTVKVSVIALLWGRSGLHLWAEWNSHSAILFWRLHLFTCQMNKVSIAATYNRQPSPDSDSPHLASAQRHINLLRSAASISQQSRAHREVHGHQGAETPPSSCTRHKRATGDEKSSQKSTQMLSFPRPGRSPKGWKGFKILTWLITNGRKIHLSFICPMLQHPF